MAVARRSKYEHCRGYWWHRCILVSALILSALSLTAWLATPLPSHSAALIPPPIYDDPSMPQRGANNIIFVETTCAVQNVSWMGLKPRQACAVESAVRHNPTSRIYLLHTCPAPEKSLILPVGATAVHTPLPEFLSDTPLYGPLVEHGALAASHWPIEHGSDIMRIVALWKYGGTYLDLDFVVLKKLSELGEDWAVAEDSYTVANCALSMSTQHGTAGSEVAAACMQSLRDEFDGEKWTHNGPALLTRVLSHRCNAEKTEAMTDCDGFRVLSTELLFPVHYESWQLYFSEEDANRTLAKLEKTYAVHVWNKLSSISQKVLPKSAYARIAYENCPVVYGSSSNHF